MQLDDALEVTKDLSPYNPAVYGFVILILIVVGYVFYKQWMYWQNKYTNNMEKTIGLLNEVNSHLENNSVTTEYVKSLKDELQNIKNDIRNR